jgi:hypothetical protein
MATADGETVKVYANGFGRWHARVTFPAPGYGPSHLDGEIDRIRARARRAIRRAVTERGESGPGWVCRVEVAATDQDSLNVTHSITYREKVTEHE